MKIFLTVFAALVYIIAIATGVGVLADAGSDAEGNMTNGWYWILAGLVFCVGTALAVAITVHLADKYDI